MIFEFDPNYNINRSDSDKDTQDNNSLGGKGGLFDRVPGGSRVAGLPTDPSVKPMVVQVRIKVNPFR